MGNGRVFIGLGLILFACVLVAIIQSYSKGVAHDTACQNSKKLLAVLQFSPYKLRAVDLTGSCASPSWLPSFSPVPLFYLAPDLVPTINRVCGVRAVFLETDNRITEKFSLAVSSDGSEITGKRRQHIRRSSSNIQPGRDCLYHHSYF